jgi:hypothetical protein
MVTRIVFLALVFCSAMPATASAAGLLKSMVCDIGPGYRIQEETLNRGEVFRADPRNKRLLMDPNVFYKLSQVAANYEFGQACLAVAGRNNGTCDVVEFLRRRDLIYYSDLQPLQAYFEDRLAQGFDSGPVAYKRIKELYSCF